MAFTVLRGQVYENAVVLVLVLPLLRSTVLTLVLFMVQVLPLCATSR